MGGLEIIHVSALEEGALRQADHGFPQLRLYQPRVEFSLEDPVLYAEPALYPDPAVDQPAVPDENGVMVKAVGAVQFLGKRDDVQVETGLQEGAHEVEPLIAQELLVGDYPFLLRVKRGEVDAGFGFALVHGGAF